jgi:hypothetical protein
MLLGLLGVAGFSNYWIGEDAFTSDYIDAAGRAFFGVLLLSASIAALRNRRRGALVLLSGTPIAAFLLSYPTAGYLIWEEGAGNFYLPLVPTAIALSFAFYAPIVLPLLLVRRIKLARWVFVVATAIAILVFATSYWTAALLPRLIGWSTFFAIFGAFWWWTARRGWPNLLAPRSGSVAQRGCFVAARVLALAVLAIIATFALEAWHSSLWTPDCSGSELFDKPLTPHDAVFTARVLWTGHHAKVDDTWAGDWAIARVETRFWGLPSSSPVVLLTNNIYGQGRRYLISGMREEGFLTRYLPIVEVTRCGHRYSRPIDDAQLQLHLLRTPARGSPRIVGSVLSATPADQRPRRRRNPIGRRRATNWFTAWLWPDDLDIYESALRELPTHKPLPGARVALTSSSGASLLVADRDGVFELPPLVPDDYTLKLLDVPVNQQCKDVTIKKEDLSTPHIHRLDLVADWKGSIEGTVRIAGEIPPSVYVELLNPDGTTAQEAFPNLPSPGISFRFEKLSPASRYLVRINRMGPTRHDPYPPLYYPLAQRRQDARVIEVHGAEHIRNIDFAVTPWAERRVRVRVTWSDHRPADGAVVYVTYQHAEPDDERIKSDDYTADTAGLAEVKIFGDNRVKIQTRTYNPPAPESSGSESGFVELDATHLPSSIDLVLRSPQPHQR